MKAMVCCCLVAQRPSNSGLYQDSHFVCFSAGRNAHSQSSHWLYETSHQSTCHIESTTCYKASDAGLTQDARQLCVLSTQREWRYKHVAYSTHLHAWHAHMCMCSLLAAECTLATDKHTSGLAVSTTHSCTMHHLCHPACTKACVHMLARTGD